MRRGLAPAIVCSLASLGAGTAQAAPAPAGAKVFQDNCQVCHQAGGVGVPGQFPRLAGRASAIAANPEGRKFLPLVVLNGMGGTVNVDGQTLVGIMPALGSLSDADIAAVLTYVAGLDPGAAKPTPFKPADVASARAAGTQSPSAVVAVRNDLFARKVVP